MTQSELAYVWALAVAIENGFADPEEALTWACCEITKQSRPSDELLELAGLVRPHPLDVVVALRRFPGRAEPLLAFRKLLARLRNVVRTDPDAWARFTSLLEQMAIAEVVPSSLEAACLRFDDQRCLAEQGVWGTLETAFDDFKTFLEVEAEPSPHTGLAVSAVRLADTAPPGWIECEFTDAEGFTHQFIEKVPVVSAAHIDQASVFPRRAALGCEIVGKVVLANATYALEVDTSRPWGIESTRGLTRFIVTARSIVTTDIDD